MEVTRIRALRGPNLWTHHTAIQAEGFRTLAEGQKVFAEGQRAKPRIR